MRGDASSQMMGGLSSFAKDPTEWRGEETELMKKVKGTMKEERVGKGLYTPPLKR